MALHGLRAKVWHTASDSMVLFQNENILVMKNNIIRAVWWRNDTIISKLLIKLKAISLYLCILYIQQTCILRTLLFSIYFQKQLKFERAYKKDITMATMYHFKSFWETRLHSAKPPLVIYLPASVCRLKGEWDLVY